MTLSYLCIIMGSCLSWVSFISSLCIIEPKFNICLPLFRYLTINTSLLFSRFFSLLMSVFPVCGFALVKSIIMCSYLMEMWLSFYESFRAISPIFLSSDFLNCGKILWDSFIAWLRYPTEPLSSSLPNIPVMSLFITPSSLISEVILKRCFHFYCLHLGFRGVLTIFPLSSWSLLNPCLLFNPYEYTACSASTQKFLRLCLEVTGSSFPLFRRVFQNFQHNFHPCMVRS